MMIPSFHFCFFVPSFPSLITFPSSPSATPLPPPSCLLHITPFDQPLHKNESIQLQASFLRKNHRDLKLATLTCLDSIVQVYGDKLAPDLVAMVMDGLPSLISDSDLHIALVRLTRHIPF